MVRGNAQGYLRTGAHQAAGTLCIVRKDAVSSPVNSSLALAIRRGSSRSTHFQSSLLVSVQRIGAWQLQPNQASTVPRGSEGQPLRILR